MIVNQKFIPTLKKAMLTASVVFALTRCSEEEMVEPAVNPSAQAASTATQSDEPNLTSLTITGVNTLFSNSKNCNCNFTVPANTHLIDGKELGIVAGHTICLEANIKYGDLEFVNMEGTLEKPILIVNKGVSETSALDAETQSGSEQDPY